jgi:hypothetical protein
MSDVRRGLCARGTVDSDSRPTADGRIVTVSTADIKAERTYVDFNYGLVFGQCSRSDISAGPTDVAEKADRVESMQP